MNHGKIVCIGQNYREHIKELRGEEPKEPVIFLKPASALIGNGDRIVIPPGIGRVDHEVELALIVGRKATRVSKGEAMAHISHIAVFNDVTARDIQSSYRKAGLPWSLSKGMDTFAPMSRPVPISSVKDLRSLRLKLTTNDEVKQDGRTDMMIFPPEVLIEFISRYMTLEPGDIIATGTPSGVSPIRPGDVIEATIDGVGKIINPVVGE
ncbi:MAG: fumarylacetoacetate hydrolase family protein [Euryarchaeota archaeon]|nr:fumarylacetoacetate hydrolase family protein [Euryarchaeota archaeon]